MEKIYDLIVNEKTWTVDISEHPLYHREHAYCELCGSKMHFRVEPREKPYSGWTKNLVYELKEVCPKGCEEFVTFEVFRYAKDNVLYTSNFEDLNSKMEYMLEKGAKKWTSK